MKVEINKNKNLIKFEKIKHSETFSLDNYVYMKLTEGWEYNCVNLYYGSLANTGKNVLVQPLSLKVVEDE